MLKRDRGFTLIELQAPSEIVHYSPLLLIPFLLKFLSTESDKSGIRPFGRFFLFSNPLSPLLLKVINIPSWSYCSGFFIGFWLQ